jgi:hypothetical protein
MARHPEGDVPDAVSAGEAQSRARWLRAAILVGLAYFLVGRLFAVPGEHARAWRLAAWAVSGIIYVMHLRYEHVSLRNPPRMLALHLAIAVAIGAFALALALMMRSVVVQGSVEPKWLLALVLFPLVTALPAFLVALVAAVALARRGGSTGDGTPTV